jgi:ADP-L-glycero-D-manno-heptose 6-epimerase
MILITGGYGFIGSNLINKINSEFVIIDNLKKKKFRKNYIKNPVKIIKEYDWVNFNFEVLNKYKFDICFHFGAKTNTLEKNLKLLISSNINFSKKIFTYCEKNKINFIYASSASVYGDGMKGFIDTKNIKKQFNYKPLNYYAKSKLEFDKFIIKKIKKTNLNKIVGLRLFNVYGINEFHKTGYSSPILKFYNQIKINNKLIVYEDFKSKKKILRDFIYIDDVVKIIKKICKLKKIREIINIGTGKPETFLKIAKIVSKKMIGDLLIKNLPSQFKNSYQYYTISNNYLIKKYKLINKFHSIGIGLDKYIKNIKNYELSSY